jgi:hypothetical protein
MNFENSQYKISIIQSPTALGNQPGRGMGWVVTRYNISSQKISFLLFTTVIKSSISERFQKSLFHFSHYSANGLGSLLTATSSMLCLFLDEDKDYRPMDGFPASESNQSRGIGKGCGHAHGTFGFSK